LVESAWAATHYKQQDKQYLKNKFYSLATRIGHKKALIAIGHKILCAVWYMLKNNQPFTSPDVKILEERIKTRQLKTYMEKIKKLGYQVALQP
jgi:hypothetical protein